MSRGKSLDSNSAASILYGHTRRQNTLLDENGHVIHIRKMQRGVKEYSDYQHRPLRIEVTDDADFPLVIDKSYQINHPATIHVAANSQGGRMIHREDGPTIEYEDGGQEYFQNGQLHRVGKPARIPGNGDSVQQEEYWHLGYQTLSEESIEHLTSQKINDNKSQLFEVVEKLNNFGLDDYTKNPDKMKDFFEYMNTRNNNAP